MVWPSESRQRAKHSAAATGQVECVVIQGSVGTWHISVLSCCISHLCVVAQYNGGAAEGRDLTAWRLLPLWQGLVHTLQGVEGPSAVFIE